MSWEVARRPWYSKWSQTWNAEVRNPDARPITEACHEVWSQKLGWHPGTHRTEAAAQLCAEHAAQRRNSAA